MYQHAPIQFNPTRTGSPGLTEDDGREDAVEEDGVGELDAEAPDLVEEEAGDHPDEHADGGVGDVGQELQQAPAPHVLVLMQPLAQEVRSVADPYCDQD